VHRSNVLVYKFQQDAQVTVFILSEDCSACFGFHYHPSSGAHNKTKTGTYIIILQNLLHFPQNIHYSTIVILIYLSTLFNSKIQLYYSVMVTRYCSYSCFVLLKIGESETPKYVEQSSDKINSVTCASCWDLYTKIFVYIFRIAILQHRPVPVFLIPNHCILI